MRRSFRTPVTAVIGLLLALVAVLLPVSPALAADVGRIAGVVTDSTGQPADGLDVRIYRWDADTEWWKTVDWAYTDESGAYESWDLAPGKYRVGFDSYHRDAPEFWNDARSLGTADDVTVVAGVVQSADAQLDPGARISGNVTGPDGGPLTGQAVVKLYHWDEQLEGWSSSWTTWTAGAFDYTGLPAGSYRLGVTSEDGDYVAEYWNDASTIGAATSITVATGQSIAGRDIQLAPAGRISGIVTDQAGSPVQDVVVTAYAWDDDYGWWVRAGSGETSEDGSYRVGGLATADYRVAFAEHHAVYVPEYWDGARRLFDADDIHVTAGSTVTGTNAVLDQGASITGTVTGPAGAPLSGVDVSAYAFDDDAQEWDAVRSASTSTNGAYELDRLPPGTYRLRFDDRSGDHVAEYWDDAPTVESATDITVGSGARVTGKNARLGAAGRITGTVTGSSGPLEDVEVAAYRLDAASGRWSYFAGAYSEANGSFDVGGLPTGAFKLRLRDYQNGHVGEWWNDKASMEEADTINVTAGATTSGRDASLAVGGHITGAVTAPDGTGLADVEVAAYRWSPLSGSWDDVSYGETDASGNYDVGSLPAGSYRIGFTTTPASTPASTGTTRPRSTAPATSRSPRVARSADGTRSSRSALPSPGPSRQQVA